MSDWGVTFPDAQAPEPSPEHRLDTLMDASGYWTALAMQEQGSRFYQALGMALDAADAHNRRLIYATWPAECWDFYQRGTLLEQHSSSEQQHSPHDGSDTAL